MQTCGLVLLEVDLPDLLLQPLHVQQPRHSVTATGLARHTVNRIAARLPPGWRYDPEIFDCTD